MSGSNHRLRTVLVFSISAGVYLLALTASTRFGLGVGLEQFTGSAGVVRPGVSYSADTPIGLGLAGAGGAAAGVDPWRAMQFMPLNLPARSSPVVDRTVVDTGAAAPAPSATPAAKTPKAAAPKSQTKDADKAKPDHQ